MSLRAKWREQGLCGACGKHPARPDKTKCQKCADANVEAQKQRRLRNLKAGLCKTCGKPKDSENQKCSKCAKVSNATDRRNDRKRRLAVLTHYSNGTPHCKCCGETEIDFLAMDHIDGGGKKHFATKELSSTCGRSIYRWLVKHSYPSGFRVLCHNCNFAYGAYGSCPHQRIKQPNTSATDSHHTGESHESEKTRTRDNQ